MRYKIIIIIVIVFFIGWLSSDLTNLSVKTLNVADSTISKIIYTNSASGSEIGKSGVPYQYIYSTNFVGTYHYIHTILPRYTNSITFSQTTFKIPAGYHGVADTIIIDGVKLYAEKGMIFIDTTGGDTLKTYIRGQWITLH